MSIFVYELLNPNVTISDWRKIRALKCLIAVNLEKDQVEFS
jgi:hypothetical protein